MRQMLFGLSSSASAVSLRALSGQTSAVSELCLFGFNHFSHVCRLFLGVLPTLHIKSRRDLWSSLLCLRLLSGFAQTF